MLQSPSTSHPRTRSCRASDGGFTLVELLVSIGIIAVLIGITIPMVSKIRLSAQGAASQGIVAQIEGACEAYHQTFHAYPGPIPNYAIYTKGTLVVLGAADIIYSYDRTKPAASAQGPALVDQGQISMAENMVLGLMGGLFRNPQTGNICYDPGLVGSGPRTLGPVIATTKSFSAFLPLTNLFKAGNGAVLNFQDDSGKADDSQIPEFVDAFNNPIPILYMRAQIGRTTPSAPSAWAPTDNPVITYMMDSRINDPANSRVSGPYDISQIISYTGCFSGSYPMLSTEQNTSPPTAIGQSIGVGKRLSKYYINSTSGTSSSGLPGGITPYHGLRTVLDAFTVSTPGAHGMPTPSGSNGEYYMPMDAFAYFNNPNQMGTPRGKDRFILISAGKDRVYGSEDDLTNFGAVVP